MPLPSLLPTAEPIANSTAEPSTAADQAMYLCTARFLRAWGEMRPAFYGCLVLNVWLGLTHASVWLVVGSLLLMLLENYFSLRLRFDALLFQDLATAAYDEKMMENSLYQLKLLPVPQTQRTALARIAGAKRLTNAYLSTLLLQISLLLISLCLERTL